MIELDAVQPGVATFGFVVRGGRGAEDHRRNARIRASLGRYLAGGLATRRIGLWLPLLESEGGRPHGRTAACAIAERSAVASPRRFNKRRREPQKALVSRAKSATGENGRIIS